MEKRRFPRFEVELKIEARGQGQESAFGRTKNFSRSGLKAVFDRFEFKTNTPLELIVQKPGSSENIKASAEPLWVIVLDDKYDVGFQFMSFAPEDKIEILEYAYSNWVKEKTSAK
jgi:hypothetical protein